MTEKRKNANENENWKTSMYMPGCRRCSPPCFLGTMSQLRIVEFLTKNLQKKGKRKRSPVYTTEQIPNKNWKWKLRISNVHDKNAEDAVELKSKLRLTVKLKLKLKLKWNTKAPMYMQECSRCGTRGSGPSSSAFMCWPVDYWDGDTLSKQPLYDKS